MSVGIRRPVVVVGILLAAAGYAAAKEWQWQAGADPLPIVQVTRVDREDSGSPNDGSWRTDAVTVQPEQIFED